MPAFNVIGGMESVGTFPFLSRVVRICTDKRRTAAHLLLFLDRSVFNKVADFNRPR